MCQDRVILILFFSTIVVVRLSSCRSTMTPCQPTNPIRIDCCYQQAHWKGLDKRTRRKIPLPSISWFVFAWILVIQVPQRCHSLILHTNHHDARLVQHCIKNDCGVVFGASVTPLALANRDSFSDTQLRDDNRNTVRNATLNDNKGSRQKRFPRNWMQRYKELQEFRKQHGHTRVGSSDTRPTCVDDNTVGHDHYPKGRQIGSDGLPTQGNERNNTASNQQASLIEWVYRQRKEYRKFQQGRTDCAMNQQMVDMLQDIGFVWDMNQQVWNERFDELLAFRKEVGHVNVPKKHKTLGQWVTKQRKEYRLGVLDPERVDRLEGIGIVWDVKEWTFQKRLEELRQFKERHGHLRVKLSDGELGPWFYSRRKEYLLWLNNEPTTLQEPHRLALEAVGFGPNLKNRRSKIEPTKVFSWDDRYEQLIFFKRIHGHVRVPSSYGTLGSWVQYQRSRRDKMPNYRQQKLDRARFVWNYKEWQWDQRFADLKTYKQTHGNTDVPMSHGNLGEWVQAQRVQYSLYLRGKKSQVTARRMTLLNQIGFDWSRGSTQTLQRELAFYRRLKELQKWKDEHHHFNVPMNVPLGKWVASQRLRYRNDKPTNVTAVPFQTYIRAVCQERSVRDPILSNKRRAELEAIGLFNDDATI